MHCIHLKEGQFIAELLFTLNSNIASFLRFIKHYYDDKEHYKLLLTLQIPEKNMLYVHLSV